MEAETLCLSLACAADDGAKAQLAALYAQLGDDEVWRLASRERMEGIVAHALERAGVQAPDRWRVAHAEVAATIAEYMDALDAIAARLADAGIPVVALKNSGIARGIYRCYGCSPMGDLDLLVRRKDFEQAHDVMLEIGYSFEFRSPLEVADLHHAVRSGGTEYSYTLPSGRRLWVELQWRPVAGRWIQPDQEPSGDAFIARSAVMPGSRALVLSPEDNLLQVSLHTAKHSYIRSPGFRLHSDVDRIVRTQPIDWNRFVGAAMSANVRTACYVSLSMARSLLGTPIPDIALRSLRINPLKTAVIESWIRRAGVFGPDTRKFSRIGYVVFVALLYDGVLALLRAACPSPRALMSHYGLRSAWLLPAYYVRRIANLVLRRSST